MLPEEKAESLINISKDYVHGYLGSSMLTNTEFPDLVLNRAKRLSKIIVDEVLSSSPRFPNEADWDDCGGTHKYYYEEERKQAEIYWKQVKEEIDKFDL